jgi:hypothetical protein
MVQRLFLRDTLLFVGFLVVSGCGGSDDSTSAESGKIAINELMASNQEGPSDEAGEYDDWIELYNNSDEEIDLSGFYLSDKSAEPLRYQIPSGTTLASKAAMIFWADNDTDQGEYHLPFKLKKTGEEVILSDAGGNVIDQLSYAEADSGKAYGRFPDGDGDFVWCTTFSPAEANGSECSE